MAEQAGENVSSLRFKILSDLTVNTESVEKEGERKAWGAAGMLPTLPRAP